MVAMMKWLRNEVGAGHAACVFDASGPTFRDAWYPEYKAQRAPMPDDLRRQIEPIHEVVRLLGWPVLSVPGIEADDAIGTLARLGAETGHRVVISTGDKDLAQLVNEQRHADQHHEQASGWTSPAWWPNSAWRRTGSSIT
jgi:DNA polymerase-1